MIDPERIRTKAQSMALAWRTREGSWPPMHALTMLLAHGEFETRLGDSWPGEHNVGATQERPLSSGERAVIGPLVPQQAHLEEAKARLAAVSLRSAGLHVDTSPVHGPYWVYFRVFESDEEGDLFFLSVVGRTGSRAVLLDPVGTETAYAAAIYKQKYFEGAHDPHATYQLRNGKWVKQVAGEPATEGPVVGGAELNISDYARALRAIRAPITAALEGWEPDRGLAIDSSVYERMTRLHEQLQQGGHEGLDAIDDLMHDTPIDPEVT